MGGVALLAPLALAALARGAQDDAWHAARTLPPGLPRAEAIARALRDAAGDPAALQERLAAAFEAFLEDHDAYRAEAARTIAEAMFAADEASWSAFCLEGILRRGGEYELADEVLAARQERATEPRERVELLERRAIVAAGAGWLARERDLLGAALAAGGTDAYQILGRLELAAGRRSAARTLFRALVARGAGDAPDGEPPAWGLRGWGLALLPRPPEPLPTATQEQGDGMAAGAPAAPLRNPPRRKD